MPEVLACLAGLSRMHVGRFAVALGCGSLAMGMAFAALGTAYADRPVVGLLLSAILPLAAWPFVRRFVRNEDQSAAKDQDANVNNAAA
jgi:membrane protein DedA with SNARE-associated domain